MSTVIPLKQCHPFFDDEAYYSQVLLKYIEKIGILNDTDQAIRRLNHVLTAISAHKQNYREIMLSIDCALNMTIDGNHLDAVNIYMCSFGSINSLLNYKANNGSDDFFYTGSIYDNYVQSLHTELEDGNSESNQCGEYTIFNNSESLCDGTYLILTLKSTPNVVQYYRNNISPYVKGENITQDIIEFAMDFSYFLGG